MDENKYAVPDGMVSAACAVLEGVASRAMTTAALEAAVRWLAENPIEPTREQFMKMSAQSPTFVYDPSHLECAVEWQRHMFIAPDPADKPAVRDTVTRLRGVALTRAEADYIIQHVEQRVRV